jgi:hypothetical protein
MPSAVGNHDARSQLFAGGVGAPGMGETFRPALEDLVRALAPSSHSYTDQWKANPSSGSPFANGTDIGSGTRGASIGSHRCSLSTASAYSRAHAGDQRLPRSHDFWTAVYQAIDD